MNPEESKKWAKLKNIILTDCKKMQISHRHHEWINKRTDPIDPYDHVAGYNQANGYFYIEEGDRGTIYLGCCSHDTEDLRWYLLKSIASHAGQNYELTHRKSDEKHWRYPRTFKDGKLILKQRIIWKYNAIHDTRKLCFEYEIKVLAKVAVPEKLEAFVNEHTNLLNRWFEQPHWGFDWKRMVFVEISESKEHD
ncbi:MAG: hypothetical protein ACRC3H_12165 [Lachnospiraceae bacterium]